MAIKRYRLRLVIEALALVLGWTYFDVSFSTELSEPIGPVVDISSRPLEMNVFDASKSISHWNFSVEAIALSRSNSSVNQPLVSTLPGSSSFAQTAYIPASEVFNSNQFQQGSAVGPKLTLNYLGDSGYGFEL